MIVGNRRLRSPLLTDGEHPVTYCWYTKGRESGLLVFDCNFTHARSRGPDNLLLKKIEELTLYMIEMQRENEALRERVKQMEGTVGQP